MLNSFFFGNYKFNFLEDKIDLQINESLFLILRKHLLTREQLKNIYAHNCKGGGGVTKQNCKLSIKKVTGVRTQRQK